MKSTNLSKRLLLLTLIALSSVLASAAGIKPLIERLQQPVTFVITEDLSPEFIEQAKYALDKYWKISEINFVIEDSAKTLKEDIDNLFLYVFKDENVDGSVKTYSNTLKLVYFGKYGKLRSNICAVALELRSIEKGKKYEMIHAVRHLQDKVRFRVDKEDEGGIQDYELYLDDNRSVLPDLTLLIRRADLDENLQSKEAIAEYYSFPVEIVSRDEFEQYVDSRDGRYAYAITGSFQTSGLSVTTSKQVVDLGTGQLLYDVESGGVKEGAFNKKDFKNLSR